MISKEEFEVLINNLRDKLDETTSALVSEELLASVSAYNNAYDEFKNMEIDMEKLKNEKDELLKVNGKLYQKIGFDKEEENVDVADDNADVEKISIDDVIDEKGELI